MFEEKPYVPPAELEDPPAKQQPPAKRQRWKCRLWWCDVPSAYDPKIFCFPIREEEPKDEPPARHRD